MRSDLAFGAAGVADRVFVEGIAPASKQDIYLLRKVLNDWPDAETEAILRRCAEAARPGDG